MKVGILTWGSRGDVMPVIALANALTARGHAVALVAPGNLAFLAEELQGATYHALTGDTEVILKSDQGKEWLAHGSVRAFMKALGDILNENEKANLEETIAACEGCDVLVVQMLMRRIGVPLAEKLNVPLLYADFIPMLPTGEFPFVFLRAAPFPLTALNNLSNWIVKKVYWQGEAGNINRVRGALGLAPIANTGNSRREEGFPRLQGYSTLLSPLPADWPRTPRKCGFWMPEPKAAPNGLPEGLEAFLGAGDKPVYIGFGSMVGDSLHLTKLAIGALRRAGKRGILLRGWAKVGINQLPHEEVALRQFAKENVFELDSCPHELLFPVCCAAVHHGGAGTTAMSVRCGLPTIVASFFADQPFWGYRLVQTGLSPATMAVRTATPQRLGDAIKQACDPRMKGRAEEIGALLAKEDGTGAAVDWIEEARKGWTGQEWARVRAQDHAEAQDPALPKRGFVPALLLLAALLVALAVAKFR